jgi:hypothetical protein
MMNCASFFDRFCRAFQCSPDGFNEAVLWHCLSPRAVSLARLLWRLDRGYFQPDFELIGQVKNVTAAEDVRDELDDFYYLHPPTGFLRKHLHVGISGQRLMELADQLFAAADGQTRWSKGAGPLPA